MPITTSNDDILISFSYEYPTEDKNLKIDFSLFYKEDILSLKVKNANKTLGVFPVSMFQEIIDFLSSKGYISQKLNTEGLYKYGSSVSNEITSVEDALSVMSSSSNSDMKDVKGEEFHGDDKSVGRSPIQSFSVDYTKSDDVSSQKDQIDSKNEGTESDEVISARRFRNDINYVDPGSTPDAKSDISNKSSTVKRT